MQTATADSSSAIATAYFFFCGRISGMSYSIGLFLIVSGVLSLVLNEFTVQVRRVWPWRRDDSNAVRDAQLNEYYRLAGYVGSVVSVEFGQWLAQLSILDWPLRVSAYAIFGGWLIWKRPALRTKQFWLSLGR